MNQAFACAAQLGLFVPMGAAPEFYILRELTKNVKSPRWGRARAGKACYPGNKVGNKVNVKSRFRGMGRGRATRAPRGSILAQQQNVALALMQFTAETQPNHAEIMIG